MPTMRARRREAMTEQPTRIRTKAEEALAGHFAALAGDDPMRDIRADAFDAFMATGPAAPAHRGVEIHRPARADAATCRRRRSRRPPDAARAALERADIFAAIDRARIVFVNGHFVPSLSDMAGLGRRCRFRLARPLSRRRRRDPRPLARSGRGADLRAEQRLRPRRRGAENPRRREARAAARDREPLRRRRRPACRRFATRSRSARAPRRRSLQTFSGPDGVAYHTNVVTEMQIGDGADVRWVTAQEEGDAGDPPRAAPAAPRRQRALRSVRLLGRRARVAQRDPHGLRGGAIRRSACAAPRSGAASSTSTRRSSSTTRRRDCARPGIFQGGDGRPVAGRFPGQDHRRAGRAEDRFEDDEPRAAPLGGRRSSPTSRSWRFSPTTWSAATARPAAGSTSRCSSSCARAASRRRRRSGCWCWPSSPRRSR